MIATRRMHARAAVLLALALAGAATAQQPKGEPAPQPKKADVPDPGPPPPSLLGPNVVPIDLPSALRMAGVQNPQLLLALERVTEAEYQRQYAVAQILPNINVGTNIDMHTGPLQQSNGNILKLNRDALYLGLGANAIAAGTVSIPGITYNLNVSEAIFGGLISRQVLRIRQAESMAVRNEILLRVSIAYMNLLRAEGRKAILVTNRTEAASVARLTAAFARQGQGLRSDADRAAADLRRRDAELIAADAEVLSASARLCQLLGLDPSTRLHAVGGWVVPCPVVPDPIPLQELLAIAMMQRPELAARRAEIQQALYALSAAKILPFSPTVIAGFSAGMFGGGSNLISEGTPFGSNAQVLHGPRFGLFNGRTDEDIIMYWTARNLGVGNVALVRAASSVARQANFREQETLNRVRAEVAEAYARTHARYAQIGTTEQAIRSSKEAFQEDYRRIENRQGRPIELSDSLRLLGQSRLEYLEAIVQYNRAQFELYVALGQPPADTLARPMPADMVPQPPSAVPPAPGGEAPPKLPEALPPQRP